MRYEITFQYKPKDYARPTGDYLPPYYRLFSNNANENIPIPNVGDVVELISLGEEDSRGFEEYFNRDYKVIYRTFRYVRKECVVIITLTDLDDGDSTQVRYRE